MFLSGLQLVSSNSRASEEVTVTVPQASVAVAVPSAALISEVATGLHARVNVVPPVVITGGMLSACPGYRSRSSS